MEKLNEFIIKQLNDKKVQRWIIKATDLIIWGFLEMMNL